MTTWLSARNHAIKMLGLQMQPLVEHKDRLHHVRVTSAIGFITGTVFAVVNMLSPGMALLGLAELLCVVLLIVPAHALSSKGQHVELAEALVLVAASGIMLALVYFGGIEGTGLFWVYTIPFLAFFLKGQRNGWWYSLGFGAVISLYFVAQPAWPQTYAYSANTRIHFLLSLGYFTVVAANMNLLRSRFEERLHARLREKSDSAQELQSRMAFLASHDTVTGLPNREQFLELVQSEMLGAEITRQGLVICTLRMERLLEMGNVMGVAGADKLVCHVSTELQRIVKDHGHVAKLRRDEFAIVYRLDQPSISAQSIGRFIAKRQFSVQDEGFSFYIDLTLGLTVYPDHSQDAPMLLKKAEQAMMQAHKNNLQWCVYDEQHDTVFKQHHLLFGKLRESLQKQHLQMHFQPQIDLNTGHIVGAEALVRWPHPKDGMIPPYAFIPVAEESGLIRPLTTWVIAECMRECARWHSLGVNVNVSINISAMNLLDPLLLTTLQKGLSETGLLPQRVNLEITESCFMSSPKRAMEVIQRIHEAGFRLSIDDFGTGYSSLSYLKSLPIDELKIDQGFVRKLLESPADQAIVASTIALAHNFGLEVVAEGIEDPDTADWLRQKGCDIGQGYTYAKPMPGADFIAFAQKLRAPAPEAKHLSLVSS